MNFQNVVTCFFKSDAINVGVFRTPTIKRNGPSNDRGAISIGRVGGLGDLVAGVSRTTADCITENTAKGKRENGAGQREVDHVV
jgi:hypothetical protein